MFCQTKIVRWCELSRTIMGTEPTPSLSLGSSRKLVVPAGLEPATNRLKVCGSTIELKHHVKEPLLNFIYSSRVFINVNYKITNAD